MNGIDWRFPALLILAMMMNAAMMWLQMRRYNSELNATLAKVHDESLMLCSGRGRSWRGGAIVIMIVNVVTDQIVSAKAMTGFTVFARFRPLPEMLGPVANAEERVATKPAKAAVAMALAQLSQASPIRSCGIDSDAANSCTQTERLPDQQSLSTTI